MVFKGIPPREMNRKLEEYRKRVIGRGGELQVKIALSMKKMKSKKRWAKLIKFTPRDRKKRKLNKEGINRKEKEGLSNLSARHEN